MRQPILAAAVCAALFSVSAQAASYSRSGTVTALRNHTLRHPYGTAQGVTILQLSSPLEGGCVWAFVDATDKNATATVLAAKTSGSPVVVWYESTAISPWGDSGICAVTAIELN